MEEITQQQCTNSALLHRSVGWSLIITIVLHDDHPTERWRRIPNSAPRTIVLHDHPTERWRRMTMTIILHDHPTFPTEVLRDGGGPPTVPQLPPPRCCVMEGDPTLWDRQQCPTLFYHRLHDAWASIDPWAYLSTEEIQRQNRSVAHKKKRDALFLKNSLFVPRPVKLGSGESIGLGLFATQPIKKHETILIEQVGVMFSQWKEPRGPFCPPTPVLVSSSTYFFPCIPRHYLGRISDVSRAYLTVCYLSAV